MLERGGEMDALRSTYKFAALLLRMGMGLTISAVNLAEFGVNYTIDHLRGEDW